MILSVHTKKDGEAAAHSHNVDVGVGTLIRRSLCLHWLMWDDAGTVEELLERSIGTISSLSLLTCVSSKHTLVCLLSPFRLCLIKEGRGRVWWAFWEGVRLLCVWSRGSEHAKPFGIGDGFQQSLPQLLLAAVLRQQQHIKASVRRR